MLQTVYELALVAALVGKHVDAKAMFFIFFKVAFVVATVRPSVYAFSVHIVIFPLALVYATVAPLIFTETCNLVGYPVTRKDTFVWPGIYSVTVLHALAVAANKAGPIWPNLLTLTLLDISHPLPLVPGAIGVDVHAESVCLVAIKLANVDIAFRMPENSLAMCSVIHPLTFVDCSRFPQVDSVAMTDILLFFYRFWRLWSETTSWGLNGERGVRRGINWKRLSILLLILIVIQITDRHNFVDCIIFFDHLPFILGSIIFKEIVIYKRQFRLILEQFRLQLFFGLLECIESIYAISKWYA